MQNTVIPSNYQYLTRLFLTAGNESNLDDPATVINDFFSFGSMEEIKDTWKKIYEAGISDEYSWTGGSPGNLFYFHEQLEKLVEACFLIYENNKKNKKWWKKTKHNAKRNAGKHLQLPCSLSKTEIKDPFRVIESFFEFYTIRKWKKHLHACLEAALSNYTVLNSIDNQDLLPCYYQLQKLMDACWYMGLEIKKRNK